MDKLTVYIIEDDPMVLEVNKGFLQRLDGFKLVGEAAEGKPAIEDIHKLQPDLILLDMYLPDMSGLELLRELRLENISSDVIMITAARDAVTIREALRFGAVDYLVKPFRFERFQEALQKFSKNYWKFNTIDKLKQEDIDLWIGSAEKISALPKGLNEFTLEQIFVGLKNEEHPLTAEQLAQKVGMARVTVRKYLDYLSVNGKVHIELQYGNIGRPTRYYSIKH
ncbi:C4-dicarboxylate response regulator [Sporosarcina newyorkensis 2681]|uniref:Transcriptional regulatory protein n=1 Tax=Sporosarcina newyorkensis 2681 TaxID=1027292 RepID=F9DQJ8_9BACL|nr:response regulator [Sporosarcina newyorkensis]EGQ26936.1 C4-dicarboxylate response regulator [Sporosarcina newyorkensis 2681]